MMHIVEKMHLNAAPHIERLVTLHIKTLILMLACIYLGSSLTVRFQCEKQVSHKFPPFSSHARIHGQ